MNKVIKMVVLVVASAVACLVQAAGTTATTEVSTIANDSSLAQVLIKPPAYKITYANSKTVVTNDWMVFVWVQRGKEFEGLTTECEAVNPETSIVLEKFQVKNGTFRPFTVAWTPDTWGERTGDIRLLLCDTRLFAADAEQRAQSSTNKSWLANQGLKIQAYGTAGQFCVEGTGGILTNSTDTAPWAEIPDYQGTEIPDDTPKPVMLDLEKGETNTTETVYFFSGQYTYTITHPYVTIPVSNTVESINYVIERSSSPNFASDVVVVSDPKAGLSDRNEILTFTVDAQKYYYYKKSSGGGGPDGGNNSSSKGPYIYDASKSVYNQRRTSYTKTTYYYRVARYIEATSGTGEELDENDYSNIEHD